VLWFWVLVIPALALALLSLRSERARAAYWKEGVARAHSERHLPPATVIVPVKGLEEGLAENLAVLTSLDYPDYELIVAARAPADIPDGAIPARARIVLAGEGDRKSSEKIGNLLAAVAAARPASEILAFADSDGRPGSLWLRALVAGLAGERTGASTGYRWHLPQPPDFWSLARSAWNAVIAGRFGAAPCDFAWGGATAIRRRDFERLRVAEFWRGSLSDDYRLSDAVREAGLEIRFAPGALTASIDHTGPGEFFGWIRRQMILTRVHRPKLWWYALVAHVVYCGATVACVVEIARGGWASLAALAAIWGLGMWKGARRAKLAAVALPGQEQWFRRHGRAYAWLTPLATWLWLYSSLASAFAREIEWRGRRYRLRGSRRPG